MAPYSKTTTQTIEKTQKSQKSTDGGATTTTPLKGYKGIFGEYVTELIWLNIIFITIWHIIALYAFLTFPYFYKVRTIMWGVVWGIASGFGVTGGAHRYWCHRSYKAKMPLQIILAICFSAAGQNTIFDWVRDHRVHHKYSETDADPHNSNRGFFFAHVGWLFMRKHPEVIRRGREIDMSDIVNDPLVQFHERHFTLFKLLFCFILPTMLPVIGWGESWYYAILTQCFARYVFVLNSTWSVNSAAHLYGYKPYDVNINPRENVAVSWFALGEGWHNYHHTFPWDYRASEFAHINLTLFWLNIFRRIGWAYDLRQPSDELIRMVRERRGDALTHNDNDSAATTTKTSVHNHHHHHHHHHHEVVSEHELYKNEERGR